MQATEGDDDLGTGRGGQGVGVWGGKALQSHSGRE